MSRHETIKEAGYKHVSFTNGEHVLEDSDGNQEIWFANKGHASYGLRYKNTDLEFARAKEVKS